MPRTVLVTGASSGIGRATALALARNGEALVLLARRTAELDEVARECHRSGALSVLTRTADVTDREALADAFAMCPELDAVVHAAGVAAYGRFTEVPPEVFDRVQEVNVIGTANVAREAVRRFQSGEGHLILFGSIVGRVVVPYFSPYVVSKWGVRGLARTLQCEVPPNVRISLVEPGGVDTTIYQKAASYLGVQGKPPPPVMSAEKIAEAVLKLLDRPKRERSIGLLNPVLTLGFRLLPSLYDRAASRLMSRVALDDRPVADHTGNLFDPVPEPLEEHDAHPR